MFDEFLFLIPARGGSKGIPQKNIKPLCGKPLIYYSLDIIRDLVKPENICVSTDDPEIIKVVKKAGFDVPFVRPASLATDESSTQDVIDHAINFYKNQHRTFKGIVLLQPTSPLRETRHILEAIGLYNESLDMVVSVKITKSNPYYVLFEENSAGFLELSKKGNFTRRQDCPQVYERNGAIFIYNLNSFNKRCFVRQKKYVMDELSSIDIDSEFDWKIAEMLLAKDK